MKKLLSLCILALSTNISCTAYESDAYKFIQEKGSYDGSKVVISSTDIFKESFCLANAPESKYFLDTNKYIANSSGSKYKIKFTAFKNLNNTKVKVNYTKESLTYTCLFPLKKPDLSVDHIEFIIEKGLDSFEAAWE